MSPVDASWNATLTIQARGERLADMLEQSMRPEVEREVPRARTELRRSASLTLELVITAKDPGAMRAALNTHLGWIQLAVATLASATAALPAGNARAE